MGHRAKPYSSPTPASGQGATNVGRVANPTRAFLDAASAPLHPQARETLLAALDAGWADPRRLHAEGRTARRLLDQGREVLAAGLGVRPTEVCFAPDGPAGLRLAVDGVRYAGRRRGGAMVASAVEHSAVLVPARDREAHDPQSTLTLAPVDALGRVDVDAFTEGLRVPGTVVAALQHANGEVGTQQPVGAVHERCAAAGVPLVVDAQASLGRTGPPAAYDVLVGDARSWGGPGGLGVVVLPERTRWSLPGVTDPDEALTGPTRHTPWLPLVLAAAEAWQQVEATRPEECADAHALVERVRSAAASIPDCEVVGDPVNRLPHVVTLSALYADGESLVRELDRLGVAVASGSACTSSTLEPSHVLAAMGALTHGNIRVTLPLVAVSPDRAHDVERLVTALPEVVAAVRAELEGRHL
jgi:cysteine desulfurase